MRLAVPVSTTNKHNRAAVPMEANGPPMMDDLVVFACRNDVSYRLSLCCGYLVDLTMTLCQYVVSLVPSHISFATWTNDMWLPHFL